MLNGFHILSTYAASWICSVLHYFGFDLGQSELTLQFQLLALIYEATYGFSFGQNQRYCFVVGTDHEGIFLLRLISDSLDLLTLLSVSYLLQLLLGTSSQFSSSC